MLRSISHGWTSWEECVQGGNRQMFQGALFQEKGWKKVSEAYGIPR